MQVFAAIHDLFETTAGEIEHAGQDKQAADPHRNQGKQRTAPAKRFCKAANAESKKKALTGDKNRDQPNAKSSKAYKTNSYRKTKIRKSNTSGRSRIPGRSHPGIRKKIIRKLNMLIIRNKRSGNITKYRAE